MKVIIRQGKCSRDQRRIQGKSVKRGYDPNQLRDPHTGEWIDAPGGPSIDTGGTISGGSEGPKYRVMRGNRSNRTPFTTQWYVVDEHGNTGMEQFPRHERRGYDTREYAEQVRTRKEAEARKPTTGDTGELTAADERVLSRIESFGYQRVPADVPEDQAQRLEAHGRARRETRRTAIPGREPIEFEVLVADEPTADAMIGGSPETSVGDYNERLYGEMNMEAFGGLAEGYEPGEALDPEDQDPLFAAGFGFDEATAINLWSSMRGYQTINRAAREGTDDPDEEALVDAMDSAIERHGKPWKGGELYRGVDLATLSPADRGELLTPGGVITDTGFGAATGRREAALDFARGGTVNYQANTADEPALLVLTDVQGNVLNLDEPMKGQWAEVLFPRESRYVVESIETDEEGVRVIRARVITDPYIKVDEKSLKRGFDPDQPRYPAGTPGGLGGQWVDIHTEAPEGGEVPEPGAPLHVRPRSTESAPPDLGHERTKLDDLVLGEGVLDTAEGFSTTDENGVRHYTAERRAVHRRIALEILDDHAEGLEDPEILFTAGGPASGKSSIIEQKEGKPPPPVTRPGDSVHLDQDIIKGKMDEYQALAKANDPYASDAVHREASDIYRVILAEAQRRRMNVVAEGTGDSGEGQFIGRIKSAKKDGYKVRVIYASAPTPTAEERAEYRAKATGRAVPLEGLRAMHSNVSKRFEEVLDNLDLIDELTVWDTREPSYEGGKPKLMYQKGYDGPPADSDVQVPNLTPGDRAGQIVSPTLLNQFRAKAAEHPGTLITLPTFV